MTDNQCFPDPEQMSDEEKLMLIETLHEAHHFNLDQIATAFDILGKTGVSINAWANYAATKGKKHPRKAVKRMARQLRKLSLAVLASIDVSEEELNQADAFATLVVDLDKELDWEAIIEEEGGQDE
jgi:threonine dehydrogenase-like Zn-dependent dehydrogenase